MNTEHFFQLLEEAKGAPDLLALAQIEFLRAAESGAERAALRAALEAAAIPHWFDVQLLGAVLDPPLKKRASELADRLRKLPFVESFRARGEQAFNVHETTRLALRARLASEDPERLNELSLRAAAVLPAPSNENSEPHLRIEALYHCLTGGDAKTVADECKALFFSFRATGRYEARLALATMLAEIIEAHVATGVARADALLRLAVEHRYHQSREQTENELREALALSEAANDCYRISACSDNLGRLLATQGQFDEALRLQRHALTIAEKRLKEMPTDLDLLANVGITESELGEVLLLRGETREALGAFRKVETILVKGVRDSRGKPLWRRNLAICLAQIGDIYYRWGDFSQALNGLREAEIIRRQLAKANPQNVTFQRDLAVSLTSIGDVFRDQGDLQAAQKAYAEMKEIITRVAPMDRDNELWQRDLAICHDRLGSVQARLGEWAEAATYCCEALELARAWLSREERIVDWYNTFAIAAANLWQVLRDAPPGRVEIGRSTAIADLRTAHALLEKRRAEGRLLPPGDANLPRITGLLREAGDSADHVFL